MVARQRQITSTMGTTRVSVPCARLQGGEGASREWHSKALGHSSAGPGEPRR